MPSATANRSFYLLTIDENLPENKAREIESRGLIAFVKDELEDREPLRSMSWIRKLSNLPENI